jgi:membrane protein DedA with SNARE-associated domain
MKRFVLAVLRFEVLLAAGALIGASVFLAADWLVSAVGRWLPAVDAVVLQWAAVGMNVPVVGAVAVVALRRRAGRDQVHG